MMSRTNMAAQPQVLTVWGVRRLMAQADNHLRHEAGRDPYCAQFGNAVQLNFVTRDESPQYYDQIFFNNNGWMMPEWKDRYGSPENPINGQLLGLMFSAKVDWSRGVPNMPFPDSPFGTRRLQLPVHLLLTPYKHLYFADFYCMETSTSDRHNVTLVLCEPGSPADQFCALRLPQLNICNNPFLCVTPPYIPHCVHVTKYVYVEIFCASEIPMNISSFMPYMRSVKMYGAGKEPHPEKTPGCPICTLQQ